MWSSIWQIEFVLHFGENFEMSCLSMSWQGLESLLRIRDEEIFLLTSTAEKFVFFSNQRNYFINNTIVFLGKRSRKNRHRTKEVTWMKRWIRKSNKIRLLAPVAVFLYRWNTYFCVRRKTYCIEFSGEEKVACKSDVVARRSRVRRKPYSTCIKLCTL